MGWKKIWSEIKLRSKLDSEKCWINKKIRFDLTKIVGLLNFSMTKVFGPIKCCLTECGSKTNFAGKGYFGSRKYLGSTKYFGSTNCWSKLFWANKIYEQKMMILYPVIIDHSVSCG